MRLCHQLRVNNCRTPTRTFCRILLLQVNILTVQADPDDIPELATEEFLEVAKTDAENKTPDCIAP